MAGGEGRGLPGPRPLAKKWERTIGAVVEAVGPDLPQLFGEAASADVFDIGGLVGKEVIGGVVGALAHVPPEAKATGLDPQVRNPFEVAGVFQGWRFARGTGFPCAGFRGSRRVVG